MSTKQSSSLAWGILTAGASVGAIASFIQIIERIQYAEQPLQKLTCDVNSVFSCTSVFDGWQSSVFGFSNSILCLMFFGITLGVALSGLFGSLPSKGLRLVMQFLSVFFLGFGAWYLQQSAFSIGALCIFCIFCYAGVIALNWAWLRINLADYGFLDSRQKNNVSASFARGVDTFAWVLWALIIAAMFVFAFR